MEGSASLRRVGSMRRTFMSGTVALKKKSICVQVKVQVVSSASLVCKKKKKKFGFSCYSETL
jgi:hypothetical protein